jgi:hypothetical protein
VPDEVTLDTTVLRRANIALQGDRITATRLARRITLLHRIQARQVCLLISTRLAVEYRDQLLPVQNEFIRAFLDLATRPDGHHVVMNWKESWSGGDRDRARNCRYPAEDDHVLRTAIRDQPTTIYTEEGRMLSVDACIYQEFGVHIREP